MQWFQHVSMPCNVMTYEHREVRCTSMLGTLVRYVHPSVCDQYSLKTLCGDSMIEAHYCILELEMG